MGVSILLAIACAFAHYLDILRRLSMVLAPLRLLNATATVLHTVFFFSVALSSPSRALGFPKQICYLGCPDFPHLCSLRTIVPSSLDIGYGFVLAACSSQPSSHYAHLCLRLRSLRTSSKFARLRRVHQPTFSSFYHKITQLVEVKKN